MTNKGGAAPGWYAPEPAKPHELRYWDGQQWSERTRDGAPDSPAPAAPPETAAVRAARPSRPWWQSWPVIVAGYLCMAIPGVVLLWLRQWTRVRTKVVGTAIGALVLVVWMAALSGGTEPEGELAAGDAPVTSASPSASPSATAQEPVATPSPTPSATASPTPSPTASSASTDEPSAQDAATGTALAALHALDVKAEYPGTDYEREAFGDGWVDVDRNGCDTRNDMLAERLESISWNGSCTIVSGDLADPFTGSWITFERGGASEVDIDHLVALSAAWSTGAADWEYAKRVAFANDPLNLEPVDAGQNRSKGDDDASEWLPPSEDFHCQYVARQVAVKTKYALWVTPAEFAAMDQVLTACPEEPMPDAGDQPVVAAGVKEPAPAKTESPEPVETTEPAPSEPEEELDPDYGACYKLPAGKGPYYKDKDPEYHYYQDRDGDGVVCE